MVRRAKVESCWSPAWCRWTPSRSPAAPCRLDPARACSSTSTPRPALASQCFKGAPAPHPRPLEMELDGAWEGAWLSPHWLGAPSHPQFRSRVGGSLSRGQPLYSLSQAGARLSLWPLVFASFPWQSQPAAARVGDSGDGLSSDPGTWVTWESYQISLSVETFLLKWRPSGGESQLAQRSEDGHGHGWRAPPVGT